MDNIRPRTSSFSPSTRSFTTRTPHRPQRPKKIMKSIWVKKESTVGSQAVLPQNGNPEEDLKDYAIIDSGCSGSMTGDKDKLSDFKEFKGGYVAFGNDPKGGRITGKGTIKTSCIDFEKVSYVEELKFNLLFVSQICDKKHNVLFTDKECLILSPKFKFVDEDLVILRAPRGVTCLVAKATKDEAVLWHKRLGHVNFKNINKRGAIDKTLFIKKDRRDIMLVQVYVDDIIFGSTKSSMVKDFEDLMQKEFKMSYMIACVEKTAQNANFYQIIDYLTRCSINYSLLVDPDLIGPWLQQFWATWLR
ncbi:ribonuclease H-like domain-containing protein [Tanacetum coccineum]